MTIITPFFLFSHDVNDHLSLTSPSHPTLHLNSSFILYLFPFHSRPPYPVFPMSIFFTFPAEPIFPPFLLIFSASLSLPQSFSTFLPLTQTPPLPPVLPFSPFLLICLRPLLLTLFLLTLRFSLAPLNPLLLTYPFTHS